MPDNANDIRIAQERLEHINRILRAIRNVNKLIISEPDVNLLIKKSCEALTENMGYFNAWVALMDETQSIVTATASSGLKGGFKGLQDRLMQGRFPACMRRILDRDHLMVIEEPPTDCPDCPLAPNYGGRSGMTSPISLGGRTYGILSVSVPFEYAHDKEEQELFREIADDLGFALQKIETELLGHRLNQIMATTPQPMSFVSNDYIHLAVNNSFAGYFAAPVDQIVGKTAAELYGPPVFEEEIKPRLDQCLRGEKLQYEALVDFPGKGLRWMEMTYTPYKRADGAVTGAISHGFDISRHKKMEERLKESERKWRKILINTPQLGITLDPRANIIFANKRFLELTGWDEKEIIGKNWFALCIPEETREEIRNFFKTVMESRTTLGFTSYENEVLKRNGERLNIAWSNVLTRDSQGNVTDVTCLGIDLTERKNAEEALKSQKDRLGFILEGTNVGAWGWNFQTGETIFDERWAKIIGYELGDISPTSIETWMRHTHPEDLQASNAALEKHFRGETEYYEIECRMKHKHGHWVWVLDRGKVISWTDDGQPLWMYGTHQDITERKRFEESLRQSEHLNRTILKMAMDGFCMLDLQGRFLEVNESFCRMSGYGEQELLNMNISDLEAGDRPDEAAAHLLKIVKNGHDRFETRHRRKDGKLFDVEVGVQYLPNEGGRFVAFLRDVTERKLAEETLKVTQKRTTAILAGIADTFYSVDNNWRFNVVNPAAEKAPFGRPATELLGKVIWELYPGLVGTRIHQHYLDAARNFTLEHYEAQSPLNQRWYEVFMQGWSGGVDVYMRDINERKRVEEALQESEAAVRNKLKVIIEPESDLGALEFSDIIDVPAVRLLMEKFHRVTGLVGAIVDNNGKVLVEVGWQDICTRFHRCHPDTLKNCIESDTMLAHGAEPGQFKTYQCKNGLWDMASPIEVSGRRMGAIYFGQFFRADEEPDLEQFLNRARRHGFNEIEYLAALDRVPRYDRETAEAVMAFYSRLAEMISSLSFSNISLSRTLTERKRVEEALRQSEAHLRTLVEALPDLVWLKDPEGVYLSCNTRFEQFFGAKESEIVGKTDYDFLDRRLADFFRDKDQAALAAGKPSMNEEEITFASDGHREILETVKTPMYDAKGALIGVLGIARDITQRKQAEEELRESEGRLRSIFSTSPDGFLIFDTEGVIVITNTAAARIYGYEEEEMAGLSGKDIVHPEYHHIFEEFKKQCLENGYFHTESVDIKKNGEPFFTEVNGSAFFFRGGTHYMAIVRDITERKQAGKEKEKLQAQLQQAQKMEAIGTLAGGVAHDFNNLLQAISGYTELLLMDKTADDHVYQSLKAIQNSSERAAELVRGLLLFSRKAETDRKPIALNIEIELARKIMERTIPKMVEIEVHSGDRLWTIMADPVQVEQILLNLGTNAADAMPDGGKLIIDTANIILDDEYAKHHPGAKPGRYVLLTVSDTGCGMDKETQGKIFEPFFTTKQLGKGTGLGLASVYGIVKSHGGYISCYSEVGQGTTFKIYFPAMDQPEIKAAREVERQPMPRGVETILFVDDEDAIRDYAQKALMKFGYKVMTALTGEEAFELYSGKTKEIDLVIMDLGMPGMGGYKCIQELLKLDPAVKIIVASGYSKGEQVKKSLEVGARGYVGKPFQLIDLLNTVRSVLDAKKSNNG